MENLGGVWFDNAGDQETKSRPYIRVYVLKILNDYRDIDRNIFSNFKKVVELEGTKKH